MSKEEQLDSEMTGEHDYLCAKTKKADNEKPILHDHRDQRNPANSCGTTVFLTPTIKDIGSKPVTISSHLPRRFLQARWDTSRYDYGSWHQL